MKPEELENHSGGAQGADLEWDRIGREFGVTNHRHYRPSDLKNMTPVEKVMMLKDVEAAAKALGRPTDFKGVELVHRNWFQIMNGDAIFAISRIIEPGETDFKGFMNNTGKQIVAGGTGWAVEMAIQKGKGVAVYDMNTDLWYFWDHNYNKFMSIDFIPTLTKAFAGIGSRQLTPNGIKAIRDVYKATFGL